MKAIYVWFYALPIWKVIVIVLVGVVIWSLLGAMMMTRHGKRWRILNAFLFAVTIAVIIYATLSRSNTGRKLVLQPFYTVIRAQKNREAYRSALMNAVLFIPIGLTVPHILPWKWKIGRKILVTLLSAALFSIVLETMQYVFCLGITEMDDVISNSIGAISGIIQLPIIALFQTSLYNKKE